MKLTKQLKEKIAEAILDHRFKADQQKLKAEHYDLAVAIYNEKYGKADRDLMATLPEGWLPVSESFYAGLAGGYDQFTLPQKCRFRSVDGLGRYGRPLIALDAEHKVSKRHAELESQEKELQAAIKSASLDVWAILDSATTVDKLRDRWPEALKIIDPIIDALPKPSTNLPAIPMPDLNARLKLPPKGVRK